MKAIFLSLDTLRADRLTCLGYHRGLTPHLDRVAAQGALFASAFASDIPTQPSHTALFTGRFGIKTGIVSHFFGPAQLAESVEWLPSMMRDAGHATGAVDHLFAMKDWFVRGYQDYMPPPGRSRSPGEVVNDIGLAWLDEHYDEDFFLFLHFWDAHIPYVPPKPYHDRFTPDSRHIVDPDITEKLQSRPSYPLFYRNNYQHIPHIPNLDYLADLYDAEVAYLDAQIGRVLARLEELGILDDTLLVIFGDHGEVMTEHDSWFDHAGLHDAVTHVPLIIRYPGRVEPGRHDSFVQLVDVFPTVAELAGLAVPADIDGRSLMPMIRGAVQTHRGEVFLSECTWQATRAIRTEEWKLIRCTDPGIYGGPAFELYHLPSDPDEQRNLAQLRPDVVAALDQRLSDWLHDQLGGRPDPQVEVLAVGLPAVARLQGVIEEDRLLAQGPDSSELEPPAA